MRPFASFALSFSAAALATLLAWSAVSVYVLDGFEAAWGRGPTLQVLVWISVGVSVLVLFSSGFGARAAGLNRQVSWPLPIALGTAFVMLSAVVGWVMESAGFPPNRLFAILWLVLSPFAIAFLAARRITGGEPVTSNKSLERTREG
jgi:hypothetical protein